MAGRCWVAVDRADRDGGDHNQPEWAQRCALAAKPLLGALASLRLARALGFLHGETIERCPARRNGLDMLTVGERADHAVTS